MDNSRHCHACLRVSRFLFADVYLRSLANMSTPREVRNPLGLFQEQIPEPGGDEVLQILSRVYQHAMKRIDDQMPSVKQLATSVLSWTTCARRPLTALELQHALAVRVGDTRLDEENLPSIEEMISACAGIVTVDEASNVKFAHNTAHAYFQHTQHLWFPDANSHFASICVTYLSFTVFENGACKSKAEFGERLRLTPFFDYAARHWGYPARETSTLGGDVIDFLQHRNLVEASSQGLMVENDVDYDDFPQGMTGFHLAAYFGIKIAVDALLLESDESDNRDSYGRTPLSWAAEKGHEAVVRQLLATGKVDADSKDGCGETPQTWAAENGHEAVVQQLLATGVVD